MNILISKLPNSGWWASGIPKYKDNPAMVEGAIPDMGLLHRERQDLISSVTDAGHKITELDFPADLDGNEPKHDFVFIRDPFISNQNGTIVILRAGEPQRRIENKVVKRCLEPLEMQMVEMPDQSSLRADGGEFYFCAREGILFSGMQRNTIEGANFVADAMNVNEMVILEGKGYHLDTFFTPVINKDGNISALVACTEVMTNESKTKLYQFADGKDIPIFEIPPNDAIGTKRKIGTFAANALPLPGVLIRPNHFSDPSIDERLADMGINIVISPTSQFQLSGGSVHCITNEL